MQITTLKIESLVFPERNVRIHTRKQIEELKRSLEMFGQTRPIIVDENNVILCGNGLTMTMKEMGLTDIQALVKRDLSENQKKKLMIADNKTFSLGLDDVDVIMQFINDMSNDLDIPGYDTDILQGMISEAEEITEQLEEFGVLTDEEKNKLANNAIRKEEKINTIQSQPQQPMTAYEAPQAPTSYSSPEGGNINQTIERPITEVRKSVVCPHCGEEIWV